MVSRAGSLDYYKIDKEPKIGDILPDIEAEQENPNTDVDDRRDNGRSGNGGSSQG